MALKGLMVKVHVMLNIRLTHIYVMSTCNLMLKSYFTNGTYFDTSDNAWFTPLSFELTFRRILEHVAGFIRCIVLDFTH
jgi:hypothetical protein